MDPADPTGRHELNPAAVGHEHRGGLGRPPERAFERDRGEIAAADLLDFARHSQSFQLVGGKPQADLAVDHTDGRRLAPVREDFDLHPPGGSTLTATRYRAIRAIDPEPRCRGCGA